MFVRAVLVLSMLSVGALEHYDRKPDTGPKSCTPPSDKLIIAELRSHAPKILSCVAEVRRKGAPVKMLTVYCGFNKHGVVIGAGIDPDDAAKQDYGKCVLSVVESMKFPTSDCDRVGIDFPIRVGR